MDEIIGLATAIAGLLLLLAFLLNELWQTDNQGVFENNQKLTLKYGSTAFDVELKEFTYPEVVFLITINSGGIQFRPRVYRSLIDEKNRKFMIQPITGRGLPFSIEGQVLDNLNIKVKVDLIRK